MRILFIFKILIILSILALACARPIPPSGGPDDTTPPQIIKAESSPNFQTRFNERVIELVFDEWIQLANPTKEIHISPPTEYIPSFKVKGKKIIVEFNEEEKLKEDVTYQINFGNSIKDFTAGNIRKNERFVFSTGDVIDSLTVTGKVVDAITKKPLADVVIALYDNLADTAFTSQKPFYFIYSNKEGQFKFENIKADSFNVYALQDLDNNYYYSVIGEKLSFNDSTLVLNDSFTNYIALELFEEEADLEFIKAINKKHGLIKFIFNRDIREKLVLESSLLNHQKIKNDTLLFWYDKGELDSTNIIIPGLDTSWYKFPERDTTSKKIKLSSKHLNAPLYSKDTIFYSINWPISNVVKDSIVLEDSLGNSLIDTVLIEGRQFGIVAKLAEGSSYNLSFLPNTLFDWQGSTNDSIAHKFKTGLNSDFGEIRLSFDANYDSIQYIVKLMKKDELIAQQLLTDSIISYTKMKPGKYSLEIIADENRNNRWDTGNLKEKTRPEIIYSFPLEQLKKSWDIETTIKLE